MRCLTSIICILYTSLSTIAQTLPPNIPWNGKSKAIMLPADSPLATPFEKSNGFFSTNPEELESIIKLMSNQAFISVSQASASPQGRPIYAIRISTDAEFRSGKKKSDKPVILIQSGIHAGEIDGLDASLMLIRDLTTGRLRSLLEKINVVVIPVINPDGFARQSEYNRINQRGPSSMGWRTNSLNRNLNRDFSKLDTPELQGLMKIINDIDPILYFDIHVTDGADYQYDITYGWTPKHGYSPGVSSWLNTYFRPYVDVSLVNYDHIPGPLIFAKNGNDFTEGNIDYIFSPRFSHAWGDAVHIPSILVENHSLKPYRQRVLGTYVFLESAMKLMAEKGADLFDVIYEDKKLRQNPVVLSWGVSKSPIDSIYFKGIDNKKEVSDLSGIEYTQWLGKIKNEKIPVYTNNSVSEKVERKKKYIIPAEYSEVISVIELHGIKFQRIQTAETLEVMMYRFKEIKMQGDLPFQGRARVKGEVNVIIKKQIFPKGSIIIDTNQPRGTFAHLLLEPDATDSFFQWGFFNGIAERTEYYENYAMVPLSEEMSRNNPELLKQFNNALATDEKLKNSPEAQVRWWYERSLYFDETYLLYPVGMIK
ncbi:MAG: M14 family metallopeptidase [Bacteroidia bacterium]